MQQQDTMLVNFFPDWFTGEIMTVPAGETIMYGQDTIIEDTSFDIFMVSFT